MNYFNYFTEIEETFVRRRGKHLLLGPVDWALIEAWKERGVPLHVALSGIERTFDSHDAKLRRHRSIKTLLYCQEEVEAQFAEWGESQLGAGEARRVEDARPAESTRLKNEEGVEQQGSPGGQPSWGSQQQSEASLPFPRPAILDHLANAREQLLTANNERAKTKPDDFCEALARAGSRLGELQKDFSAAACPNAEQLEASLTQLEELLDRELRQCLAPDELGQATGAAEAQLRPYRERMELATYEQTLNNLVAKNLRTSHGVPRLSLFYL